MGRCIAGFALVLVACGAAEDGSPDKRKPGPPQTFTEYRIEEQSFYLPSHTVDALLVVDGTSSMEERWDRVLETSLALHDALMASGIDFRLGVIRSDERTLRIEKGLRWIERDTPQPTAWLNAVLPVSGLTNESDPIDTVYVVVEVDNNGDFDREEAMLEAIVLTDSIDKSSFSEQELVNYFETLKYPDVPTAMHAVTPLTGCPFTLRAEKLETVVTETGGVLHDTCEPSWTAFVDAVADRWAFEPRLHFPLKYEPDDEVSVEVLVGETWVGTAEFWAYDADENAVVFVDDHPYPPTSEVRVQYATTSPWVGP